MKKIILFVILVAIFFAIPGNASEQQKEIYFFCGAAVRVPMDEIIKKYENEKGIKVSVIYSGSGTLLSQMELSKKGDVYLCGSPDYISMGEKRNLLIKGSAKLVSYLVPAIIVPKGNPAGIHSLEDLAKPGVRVGLGNPENVCLGLYAIEIFEKNHLLEKVLPNVVVFAKSCEDTAMLVVLRKVDAVIGWDVFAAWNPNDVEWVKIENNKIPRLSYIAIAIPVFARDQSLSRDFINYVLSKEGRAIFKKWKYIATEREAKKYAPKARIGGEYKLPEEYFKLIRHEK